MHAPLRSIARLAAVAALFTTLAAPGLEAKIGRGGSLGSRGDRTYSAPAPTTTAPRGAQPMQRTETPNVGQSAPGSMAGAAQQPRRFGFGSGMMAGLLGAGLLGMLMGHGFMGGLSGLMSMFGLLLQVALIGGLVWLAIRFFRRRSEPAMAGAGAGPGMAGAGMARSALGGANQAHGMTGGGQPAQAPVSIGDQDFAAFERALTEIQAAYGREDMNALSHHATPEMLRYFGADLEDDRSKGLRNHVAEAKLLQGDLAEAWRQGGSEYATVAMRFSLIDATLDRATGKVVSGDLTRPQESTELWTFRRDGGGPWILSAIQQGG